MDTGASSGSYCADNVVGVLKGMGALLDTTDTPTRVCSVLGSAE